MMSLAKSTPSPSLRKEITSLLDFLPTSTYLDDIIDDVLPTQQGATHAAQQQSSLFTLPAGLSQPSIPSAKAPAVEEPIVHIDVNYSLAPGFTPIGKQWTLTQREKDDISGSISQTWTDQAIRCFMTASDCANCDIPNGCYSFACQMNKVVPILLEDLGAPDIRRVKRIYPQGFNSTGAEGLKADAIIEPFIHQEDDDDLVTG
jgi:hypothetical protein